jgi:hypothetical protein
VGQRIQSGGSRVEEQGVQSGEKRVLESQVNSKTVKYLFFQQNQHTDHSILITPGLTHRGTGQGSGEIPKRKWGKGNPEAAIVIKSPNKIG